MVSGILLVNQKVCKMSAKINLENMEITPATLSQYRSRDEMLELVSEWMANQFNDYADVVRYNTDFGLLTRFIMDNYPIK